jgi:hypothetical protein
MNTNEKAREARVRASGRLRRMTIGTAIIGIAATGGFGALAAVTYDGTPAAAATSTTAITTTGTTATSSTATKAAPAVTTTTGVAHVSSGGS